MNTCDVPVTQWPNVLSSLVTLVIVILPYHFRVLEETGDHVSGLVPTQTVSGLFPSWGRSLDVGGFYPGCLASSPVFNWGADMENVQNFT